MQRKANYQSGLRKSGWPVEARSLCHMRSSISIREAFWPAITSMGKYTLTPRTMAEEKQVYPAIAACTAF